LDTFTEVTTEVTTELTTELSARKKQYAYYRDQLLSFEGGEVEWKMLGDVAEIGTGSHDTQDAVENGDFVFYARGREPLRLNAFDFDETAIITAGDGAGVGKVFHYAQGKYALHQRAYRIVPGAAMEPRFLYHYIASSFYAYIQRASVSSSVTSLRRPMFLDFPVPVPALSEQARIVTILDKFDTLVNSITEGLPREIELRQKQYAYYRDLLLNFPKPDEVEA
jgi:type I restriction enzyme S subunit